MIMEEVTHEGSQWPCGDIENQGLGVKKRVGELLVSHSLPRERKCGAGFFVPVHVASSQPEQGQAHSRDSVNVV